MALDCLPCRRAVDAQRGAGYRLGIHIAIYDVGIGHRRFCAAARIAHRSGLGASTLRPDAQRAAVVDPRNTATTGPYLDNIQRRNPQCVPAFIELVGRDVDAATYFAGGFFSWETVFYETRFGRRASHVERKDLVQSRFLGQPRRVQHAGGRT